MLGNINNKDDLRIEKQLQDDEKTGWIIPTGKLVLYKCYLTGILRNNLAR